MPIRVVRAMRALVTAPDARVLVVPPLRTAAGWRISPPGFLGAPRLGAREAVGRLATRHRDRNR